MSEKPLTPIDIQSWLLTEDKKEKIISYINNRLKFAQLNSEKKIEVGIPLSDIYEDLGKIHVDLLLDFLIDSYRQWVVNVSNSKLYFTSPKQYEFKYKR